MNEIDTIFSSIITRFKTEVADIVGGADQGYTYVYDNDPTENFSPPESTDDNTRRAWIRVSLLPGEAFQVDFGSPGNNRFRQPGILQVSIHIPTDIGDKSGTELADKVAGPFRSKNVGGVLYKSPYPRVLGNRGAWWRIDVICPWHSDYLS